MECNISFQNFVELLVTYADCRLFVKYLKIIIYLACIYIILQLAVQLV